MPHSAAPGGVGCSVAESVCACKARFRSVCEGLSADNEHEGNHYCVLHLPRKHETLAPKFKEAVEKKLKAKDFNFGDVYFPDIARLTYLWPKVTFEGYVQFTEATFEGRADFSSATFEERANFSWASFARVSPEERVFPSFAYFSRATFKEEADFTRASFKEEADFHRGTFELDFSHLRAKGIEIRASA
jgi:hypothetical protein